MLKLHQNFLLAFSILFFTITYLPTDSFGMDETEREVIISYKSNIGKQLIIEKSNEINYKFTRTSAIAVSIDQIVLDELKQNSNIKYIEKNVPIVLSNRSQNIEEIPKVKQKNESDRWNIQSINGYSAWEDGFTGKGVNIAVIDTGISPHSDLIVSGGISTVNSKMEYTDDNGHGTHVAGIIGGERNNIGIDGVAPDANIFAVKALNSNGEGTLTDLLEAIEWSIQHDMDIINLSLGTDYNSRSMQEIIGKAYKAGILIVSSSGNGGEGSNVLYPAKYKNVIGVSAIDKQLNITPFSSRGPEIEYSAPGKGIVSTYFNDKYGIASGTSQASPHVAGMLALLKQKYPEMTPIDLRKELVKNTRDLGERGRDPMYGHGLINYQPDVIAPEEVANIQVRGKTARTFSISWKNPQNEDFVKTNIYINDNFLKSVSRKEESTYTFTGLNPGTEYKYSIYTEDHFGNVSEGIAQTVETNIAESADEEHISNSNIVDNKQMGVEEDKDFNSDEQTIEDKEPEESNTSEKQLDARNEEEEVTVSLPSSINETNKKEKNNSKDIDGTGKKSPEITIEKSEETVNSSKKDKQTERGVSKGITESSVADGIKRMTKESSSTSTDDKSKEDNNTEESRDKNMVARLFGAIAKIFITITDWIAILF
ncbi:S8 family serine peptidase [Virgibacillus sp. L01]|uniref:S8 family serine peptidase n=1 Tax=Virgibacillus sp. L01 TaxID=3457429 RepID=UPI003FCF8B41